jgi:hypothetical protein
VPEEVLKKHLFAFLSDRATAHLNANCCIDDHAAYRSVSILGQVFPLLTGSSDARQQSFSNHVHEQMTLQHDGIQFWLGRRHVYSSRAVKAARNNVTIASMFALLAFTYMFSPIKSIHSLHLCVESLC